MTHICNYCKKSFVKESSLLVHSCEPRRRRQQKDEPEVRLGFYAYLKFYEIAQGSSKLKTYDDFCDSPYYRAFVKFGRYCVSVRVVDPEKFVEWLLKHNKKLDHWCKDSIYNEYLIQHLQTENVDHALARAMEYAIKWNEQTGNPAEHCLRYGNENAIVYAITAGRISPWILYNCESGQKVLSELDQTQISMIWPYIDSEVWVKRFSDYLADQEYVKDILKQAGW